MAPRVTSEIFIGALLRTARSGGAFCYVARRGNAQAGAIVIALADHALGSYDIYQDAPPTIADASDGKNAGRHFTLTRTLDGDDALRQFVESESRFDPDFWMVEIENWTGPLDGLLTVVDGD
ncbi:MAG: DUF1491 family protein [Roseitalea sp.]|jgi:hypothetical protein|nr:DUF1491 family protein [Roseitalea sp.]MBO6720514.1 DUF1491 family protein [Roseitalea sp.]MBO6743661.1 DUF1491 family protein [Roseitalea sp.]